MPQNDLFYSTEELPYSFHLLMAHFPASFLLTTPELRYSRRMAKVSSYLVKGTNPALQETCAESHTQATQLYMSIEVFGHVCQFARYTHGCISSLY